MLTYLDMVKGDTPTWDFILGNDQGVSNLTGCSLLFKARSSPDSTPLITHTNLDGGVVASNPPQGICTLSLSAGDTATLDSKTETDLFFDIQVTFPNGAVITAVRGFIKVAPDASY